MGKRIFLVIICLAGFCGLSRGQEKNEEAKIITLGVLNEKATSLPVPQVPRSHLQPRISGNVIVQVKIDLQKGVVVSVNAVSGPALLKPAAEMAARQATFEPVLQEFNTIYGLGSLIYKLEDFNGKTIENKKPKPILPVLKNGIACGKAVSLPKPVYPPEAKDSCAAGEVKVKILLDENGSVIEANAISGDERLRNASVEAAKKVRYSPSKFPTEGLLVYNFVSEKRCLTAGVVNQKAIDLPKPKVPNNHFRINEEQIVAVQIVIDESGKVINADSIFGHALLRQASEFAAREAKFHPTFINPGQIKIKALLVYKFKTDGTVETNIKKDDPPVLGKPLNLKAPTPPFCNCKFGSNPTVLVQAEIDEQGNVVRAAAISGHALLKQTSEQAARHSKFLPVNLKTKVLILYHFEEVDKWSVKAGNIEIKLVKILKPN